MTTDDFHALQRPARRTIILETLARHHGRAPLVRLPPDADTWSVLEGLVAAGLVERDRHFAQLTKSGRRLVREERDRSEVREDSGQPLSADDILRLDSAYCEPSPVFAFAMIASAVVLVWALWKVFA